MVRIGMLSFAHMHAESYARCLRAMPNVAVVGIADDDAARGRREADKFETAYYQSHEALLAERLDAVVVCSENARHRPLVEMAAHAGAHVLCEKPIATSLADAQAMIAACEQAGVRLQIAFPVRFAAPVQRVKALMDSGKLGRIYGAKTTNHGRMPGGWFTDVSLAGGGAVMDHTVHVVDALRWLWGREVTSVYAEVGRLFHNIPCDDAGMVTLQWGEEGPFTTLDCSWSRPASFPTWGDVTMEIIGEKGVLFLDVFAQNINVYSDETMRATWQNWGSDSNLALVRDFVAMVEQGRAPSVTGLDGLRALEVALAAYRSAQLERPVNLPLEPAQA